MDILKVIMTRRSIRKFSGQVISDENLELILKAGFQAPSAHNREPREFVVVIKKSRLNEISEFHRYAKMLPKAGCGIVVCGDKTKQEEIGFLTEDCSASIQNMLLAAHGLGLGAVWCGLYPVSDYVKKISKILNLPEHIIPIGMVVVGEKDEDREIIDRFNPKSIHYDNWTAENKK